MALRRILLTRCNKLTAEVTSDFDIAKYIRT